jgi:hypothetical protein
MEELEYETVVANLMSPWYCVQVQRKENIKNMTSYGLLIGQHISSLPPEENMLMHMYLFTLTTLP